jgi:ankyrin repeat protein
MKKLATLFFAFHLLGCSNAQKKDEMKENIQSKKEIYLSHDIRLFKDSKAWELANAVNVQDTNKIKEICLKDSSLINYQETQNGQSILCWAVGMFYYNSAKTLLDIGANPNLQDDSGVSAFIEASLNDDTEKYVELLLGYGGDVNAVAKPKDGQNQHFKTPLITAAQSNLKIVKLLIENGADINYTNKYYESALSSACTFKKIEIIKYLIENGADFKRPIYIVESRNEKIFLSDELRRMSFMLDDKSYKTKMEIVAILLKNGIDYRKSPIPKEYLESLPKEYLDVY